MQKYSLNDHWEVAEGTLRNPLMMNMIQGWKKCHVPHDYSMVKERNPNSSTEDNEGWTQGAAVFYKKEFMVDAAAIGKRFWLEFEGISGVCQIWVNRQYVAKHMNPYTGVFVEVTKHIKAGENLIQVHIDSRMKPNSRWYVGTGITRRVWMHVAEQVTIVPESLQVRTAKMEDNHASLQVKAALTGKADSVVFCVKDKVGNTLQSTQAQFDGRLATAMIEVKGIIPWCPETPELYFVEACVKAGETEDVSRVRTGIRTIAVNPKDGFLLNGKPTKLKGSCVHHDMGILGAAGYKAAEFRRVRTLKENGYNAIRGAHNPFGPAFYEACDELGMLAVEEAFDEWVLGRTDFGLHITFEDRWERDIEDMIRRDYNHPSIIMWSTGNEVEERDGSADGFEWSRRLAEKVKEMDDSRPVTAAACSLFSEYGQRPKQGEDQGTTGNQALNMAYDNFASGVDLWGDTTKAYFEPLDVAGYNYKIVRYEHDGKKFPNRVICGSETYPRAAFASWQATMRNNHVIGDFVWTAWDYIGEAGIGRWEVSDEARPAPTKYPWLLAHCGDIDLLGNKRPQSYYRDVVWGIAKAPKLFCLPPDLVDKNIARLSWTWLPVQRSYTFEGCEGQPMEVHIYADADEVELIQNGKSIGTCACTEKEEYHAVFRVAYAPGTLETIAYKNGEETGRDSLITAGATIAIEIKAESPMPVVGKDLRFVLFRAVDEKGTLVYGETATISVNVAGGELLALGNADPKPDRLIPYGEESVPLYEGVAMAVIRGNGSAEPCKVDISLNNGITAETSFAFELAEECEDALVHDAKPGVLDFPLGELMDNKNAFDVLKNTMGTLLSNPMLDFMKSMNLKKILSMSNQNVPNGLAVALEEALSEGGRA